MKVTYFSIKWHALLWKERKKKHHWHEEMLKVRKQEAGNDTNRMITSRDGEIAVCWHADIGINGKITSRDE